MDFSQTETKWICMYIYIYNKQKKPQRETRDDTKFWCVDGVLVSRRRCQLPSYSSY